MFQSSKRGTQNMKRTPFAAWLLLLVSLSLIVKIININSDNSPLIGIQMVIFWLTLAVIGVAVSKRVTHHKTRSFLSNLFVISFIIRTVSAMILLKVIPTMVSGHDYLSYGFLGDDGILYDQLGWNVIENVKKGVDPLTGVRTVGPGYILLNSVLYYIFGHNIEFVRIFNSFLGSLVPVFLFSIIQRFMPLRYAKGTAILVAFYPELILYSGSHLKGTSVSFSLMLGTWSVVQLIYSKKSFNKILLLGLLSSCLLYLALTRFYYVFAISFAWLLFVKEKKSAVMILDQSLLKMVFLIGLFIGIFFVAQSYLPYIITSAMVHIQKIPEIAIGHHADGQSFYSIFPISISNPLFLPIGLTYTLLNPFILWPFLNSDPVFTLLSPSIVIWYVLLPFFFYGIFNSEKRGVQGLILYITLFSLIGIILSGGGVIATGRIKMPINPFLLMYAMMGIKAFYENNQGIRILIFLYSILFFLGLLFYLFVKGNLAIVIGLGSSLLITFFIVIFSSTKRLKENKVNPGAN